MNKARVITFVGIVCLAVIAAIILPLTPAKAETGDEQHGKMGMMGMKKDMKKHMKSDVLTLEKIHSKHVPMVSKAIEKAIEAIEAGNNKAALTELHKAKKMLAIINEAIGKQVKPKFANIRCPIYGTPIEPDKVTKDLIREYKGQKVAFCCEDCPPKWDKLTDVEKKAKLAKAKPKSAKGHSGHKSDEQAHSEEHVEVLPAGANQICPVLPEEKVDPAFYVEYKGKRIYVCCKKCVKRVKENPAAWYDKAYSHEHDH